MLVVRFLSKLGFFWNDSGLRFEDKEDQESI